MRSNGPVTLSLPPFRGITRRILLTSGIIFLALSALGLFWPDLEIIALGLIALQPLLAMRVMIWQFVTYPFATTSLMSLLFSGLSVWFFGSALEEERGSRWFAEYFFLTSIAGGLLAALLGRAAIGHIAGFVATEGTSGLWPAVLAMLVAYAYFDPERELRLYFVVSVKAKYLAAMYVAVDLVLTLLGGDKFGALTSVCVALCAYGYLRLAPRKGLRFAVSERWFGIRNAYYRAKRRRAAKKFTVYMKKQGSDANFDESGRYVDPSGTPRDPNDKRWMN